MFFRWVGGVADHTDDWATAGNWEDESGAAYTNLCPGDTSGRLDDVVYDAATTYGIAGCEVDYPLNSFKISPSANHSVGSSATYLKFSAQTLVINASAAVYIEGDTAGIIDILQLGMLSSTGAYFKGVLGVLTNISGSAYVVSGSLSDFAVGSGDSNVCSLTISAGVTLSTGACRGGIITNSSSITDAVVMSGKWTQSAGDINSVFLYAGEYQWDGGNITGWGYVYGGTLTAAKNTEQRRAVGFDLYTGGVLNLDNGMGSVHVTDRIRLFGGSIGATKRTALSETLNVPATNASNPADLDQFAYSSMSESSDLSSTGDYLAVYDQRVAYMAVGANATGIKFEWQASTDDTMSDPEAISGAYTITAGNTNKVCKLAVRGYELPTDKKFVFMKVTTLATAGTTTVSGALETRRVAS